MALDTATAYKAWAGSTVADATATTAIAAATRMLERMCGRDSGGFESANRTERYHGTGRDFLHLRHWPVTTLTSVSYRTGKGTFIGLDSSTYDIDERDENRGRVYIVNPSEVAYDWPGSPRFFVRGNDFWQVVYTGGYDVAGTDANVPDLPADLLEALRLLTTHVLARAGQDPAILSEALGSYNYTLRDDQATARSVAMLIGPWKPAGAYL